MKSLIKPTQVYGWDGFTLTSGSISLSIIPNIGGRIMSLIYQGHELLFVDLRHRGEVFNSAQWGHLVESKKVMGFRVWGGDKTWVAPQKEWLGGTPPLDLDAAPYSLSWNGQEAIMTSPVCRETGLQIIRRVSLKDEQVYLIEELYNRTDQSLQKGLWNVTQLKRPCYFEIPTEEGDFRSYHHEDSTLPVFNGTLSPQAGLLRIDCNDRKLFKVGGMSRSSTLTIGIPTMDGLIFWKKSFSCDPKASYAHHSMVEIFNALGQDYAEIEIHSPFKILAPDECVRLEQSWQISSCSSKAEALQ